MSNLVLWGHHLDEYKEMFDLTPAEIKNSLLEFSCGPSAVNVELQGIARECVSADPLFCLDKATLVSKATLIFGEMVTEVSQDQHKFDFTRYGGLEGLVEKRRAGMATFFEDYILGKKQQRYLPVQEMDLPFNDFHFDLALSSHYLFGEIENLNLDFHILVLKELARVAKEVRVFPLIDRNGQPSPFLGPVLLRLQQENFGVEVRTVNYSLQPQGNAMLRIWAQECPIG